MNILLVEDEIQERENWTETLDTISEKLKSERDIHLLNAKDVKEAESNIKNNKIDFLVVDLTLGDDPDGGNNFLKTIRQYGLRIPTIILTATPDTVQDESYVLKTYKKGETDIPEILNYIINIYDTGITEVLSRDGLVQKIVNKFYQEIFISNKELWIRRQQENNKTISNSSSTANPKEMVKRSLLKILLNNLNAYIDYDEDKAYSEQFYIYPFSNNNISTGSILKEKNSENFFLLISPACDMVLRPQKDGSKKMKLDNLHLLSVMQNPQWNKDKENDMKKNKNEKYHFLPKTNNFKGGYIDFADIHLCKYENIENDYSVVYKIADQFMRNIISRFAAYFARQGQPDLFTGQEEVVNIGFMESKYIEYLTEYLPFDKDGKEKQPKEDKKKIYYYYALKSISCPKINKKSKFLSFKEATSINEIELYNFTAKLNKPQIVSKEKMCCLIYGNDAEKYKTDHKEDVYVIAQLTNLQYAEDNFLKKVKDEIKRRAITPSLEIQQIELPQE